MDSTHPPTHTRVHTHLHTHAHDTQRWWLTLRISSCKYVAVSNNITIQSNCAVCLRYTVICVCHLYPQHLSLRRDKNKSEGREEKEEKCFCVMKTPSLFLSLSLPRSSSISLCSASSRCQRQSERRKGGSAAWQAGRLLAGWFGSLPTLCFPACLKLDLFPLLDFASVSNSFSCLSIYLQLFTVEYAATPREQKKKKQKHAKP